MRPKAFRFSQNLRDLVTADPAVQPLLDIHDRELEEFVSSRWDYGSYSATTDVGGNVVVPHLCGVVPGYVSVTPRGGNRVLSVIGLTATAFTVNITDLNGNPLAVVDVSFFYDARPPANT